MITVLRSPAPIELTEGEVPVEVLSTDADGKLVVDTGGVRARMIINPARSPSTKISIFLAWRASDGSQYDIRFFSLAFAGGPPAELPNFHNYQGPIRDYWNEVADIIGSHIDIEPWFHVYIEAEADGRLSLYAVAKEQDLSWSVSWWVGDRYVSVENDLPPTTNAQYTVRLDVVVANEREGWTSVGRIGASPDSRSRVHFDIGGILSSMVRDELPHPAIPAWSTDAPYEPLNLRSYYLRISEYSDREGFLSSIYVRGRRCFAGGTSAVIQARGNFFENLSTKNSWLTNRPDRRTVGTDEPVYLGFVQRYFTSTASELSLEVEEFTASGEIRTTSHFGDLGFTSPTFEPIVYPVGYRALGIGEDTLYYTVTVRRPRGHLTALAVAPPRTFIVDRSQYENVRYLAYLNSFFLPEVVRCTGRVVRELDVEYTRFDKVRRRSDGVEYGDTENIAAQVRESYTFATGYKPQLEIETILQEISRSPRLYEITSTGFTPLVATGKSFLTGAEDENLHSAIIPCELGIVDRSYGRYDDLLRAPEPDYWSGPDGEAWQGPNEQPWSN